MEKYYISISNKEEFDIWIKQLESLWYKMSDYYGNVLINWCLTYWNIIWSDDWFIRFSSKCNYEWCKKLPLLKVWIRFIFNNWNAKYEIKSIDNSEVRYIHLWTRNIYICVLDKIITRINIIDSNKQEELKWLPKYFVIKKPKCWSWYLDKLWEEYIEWIKDKSWFSWWLNKEYIWYDWNSNWYNWYEWSNYINQFKKNPTLITLEQWYNVISKSEEIKYKTIKEESICWIDTSVVTTDYHWNIIEPILNTNKNNTMNNLNEMRAKKYFSTEKNLVAIEKLSDTLDTISETLWKARQEITTVDKKILALKDLLNDAVEANNLKTVKELVGSLKDIESFVNELNNKTIKSFTPVETKFDINSLLK